MSKQEKTVFVTAIGGDIGSSVLRCIRRGYPCDRLLGCDIEPYVQGRDAVDAFYTAPPYADEEAYVAFIQRTCLEQRVTHFFPMGEPEILIAARRREFFKAQGIVLLINNDRILEIASSKFRTAQFLRQNGIPAPQTWYKEEYGGELGYPLIVKADRGCGSRELRVVHTKEEWEALADLSGRDYVAQAYIGDAEHEYTTGVFSDGENVRSVTFRRKLGYGGMSVRVETVEDIRIEEMAEKTARLLQLKGSMNLQMRLTQDGYSIFEINPRISSTAGFRDKIGYHDVVWWLRSMDGEAVGRTEKIPAGIIGIRTLDEKIFMPDAAGGQTGLQG